MTGVSRQAWIGVALVLLYTFLISSADAITKFIAKGYAAPQLFAFSGAVVVGLSLLSARIGRGKGHSLHTSCPGAMALRAVLTVVGSVAFFQAFRLLPFAEVFVFIALMPLFAGLLSGPVLGEHVRPVVWGALGAGAVGVLCLFPGGLAEVTGGHLVALLACACGALSLVLARFIGRRESNSIAQVFYPNLALFVVMALALPVVYKPMPLTDLLWVGAYAGFLFVARWVSVVALRLLAAYVVMPLMNLQFVWMVLLGAMFFGEVPGAHVYLGVAIVIASGVFLIYDQMQPDTVESAVQRRVSNFMRRAKSVR